MVDRMYCSFFWTICLTERADLCTTLIAFLVKKKTLLLQQICPMVGRISYSVFWTNCLKEQNDISTTLIQFIVKKNTSPLQQICPFLAECLTVFAGQSAFQSELTSAPHSSHFL
jgi:hypothetical protein